MRWLTAVLAVLWLGAMAVLQTRSVTERSAWIAACQQDEACAGRRVFLALVRVLEVEEDRYRVRKMEDEHLIVGEVDGLEVGQTVSVVARWEGDQLIETERTPHPWRKEKEALGFVGLLMTGGLLLAGFRWEGGLLPRG